MIATPLSSFPASSLDTFTPMLEIIGLEASLWPLSLLFYTSPEVGPHSMVDTVQCPSHWWADREWAVGRARRGLLLAVQRHNRWELGRIWGRRVPLVLGQPGKHSKNMSHKTKWNRHGIPCDSMGEPWVKPATKGLMFMIRFTWSV